MPRHVCAADSRPPMGFVLDELVRRAQAEIEAAAWHEQEHPGPGIEFDRAVDGVMDLLENELVPSNMLGAAGTKKFLLKRFPYDIIKRDVSEEIIVVAIAHQSRRLLPGCRNPAACFRPNPWLRPRQPSQRQSGCCGIRLRMDELYLRINGV